MGPCFSHFLTSLYKCSFFCAAMAKTRVSFFSVSYGDHTRHETTHKYRVPGNVNTYNVPSITPHQCCRCSLQQVPRSCSYKEKGDAVRIEPPPPSPSAFRLCLPPLRTQLAGAVLTTSERRRHPGAERSRLVETIVSAL